MCKTNDPLTTMSETLPTPESPGPDSRIKAGALPPAGCLLVRRSWRTRQYLAGRSLALCSAASSRCWWSSVLRSRCIKNAPFFFWSMDLRPRDPWRLRLALWAPARARRRRDAGRRQAGAVGLPPQPDQRLDVCFLLLRDRPGRHQPGQLLRHGGRRGRLGSSPVWSKAQTVPSN